MLIKDFGYQLPDDRIAKYPLADRDESKLLVYTNGEIKESVYRSLAAFVPERTHLVFNNTKVVEVRLLFQKSSGSTIELFCLEPAGNYPDITSAMTQRGSVFWKCLVGGAKKWKDDDLCMRKIIDGTERLLFAQKVEKQGDSFLIRFAWNDDDLTFAEILHLFGAIPLPPYLNRNADEDDKNRYQTIYAKWDGSVAAPTAGLHFTKQLFESLAIKGITTDFVTLHVGAGTFKPVKTENVRDHEMHAEFIEVSIENIQNLLQKQEEKIIAVGTTSLRTLESLYWLGVKTVADENTSDDQLFLTQWEAYGLPQNVPVANALQSLLKWMQKRNLLKLITKTQIMILPGYHLKMADALITNFHQPHSTLLLLIAAITGDDWKHIYDYALLNDFRFLSYGDGSLLWNRFGR